MFNGRSPGFVKGRGNRLGVQSLEALKVNFMGYSTFTLNLFISITPNDLLNYLSALVCMYNVKSYTFFGCSIRSNILVVTKRGDVSKSATDDVPFHRSV